MLLDWAAGVALVCGAAGCAAAALRRRDRNPFAAAGFAAALGCAGIAEAAGTSLWLSLAACAFALIGIGALIVHRLGRPSRLSWLDAGMGASAVGALVTTSGPAAPAVLGAAGFAAALGLSRWRTTPALLCGMAGLVLLSADDAVAAFAVVPLVVAASLDEPRVGPGPDFSPIVLTAVLSFATSSLTLLTVGQFISLPPVAAVLAIVTVLVGMARAGLTVVERLRLSHLQALTDDLTGLGNRRQLIERLHASLERARVGGSEVALLLVDLDGFKELNDTLGHHAGDQVLRQIGPRLHHLLREEDTLARLGGDEFAVVLDPGDEAGASVAGLRLRAALEQSFEVGGLHVHIDASVGIALFPHHAHDALGLLQRADVAMYEAKRAAHRL